MTGLDHARLADAILPAVLAAGRIEMDYYRGTVEVERKSDSSPVTAADREAEAVIVAALAQISPEVPVIAEESAALIEPANPAGDFFLVDPLDGTREFVKRRGEFTINVGLISGRRPVFGVVYAPALEELYVTLDRDRAVLVRLSPETRVRSLAECETIPLRTRDPDPKALVALGSLSHGSSATDAFLSHFPISETRAAGSSLKFCLIARGEADLYPRIGDTSQWDTAAGQAVLQAAGGSVTTLDGAPLSYGKTGRGFLNPHFVAWGRGPIAPTP